MNTITNTNNIFSKQNKHGICILFNHLKFQNASHRHTQVSKGKLTDRRL